jgi:hypothetical protein
MKEEGGFLRRLLVFTGMLLLIMDDGLAYIYIFFFLFLPGFSFLINEQK